MARDHSLEAREHLAALLQHADRWPLLADVGDLLRVEIDVGRLVDVTPLSQELARRREDLDAAVLAVADVHLALAIDPEAVRQVELARLFLAGLPPRIQQGPLAREPMHPAVAVAVCGVQG